MHMKIPKLSETQSGSFNILSVEFTKIAILFAPQSAQMSFPEVVFCSSMSSFRLGEAMGSASGSLSMSRTKLQIETLHHRLYPCFFCQSCCPQWNSAPTYCTLPVEHWLSCILNVRRRKPRWPMSTSANLGPSLH